MEGYGNDVLPRFVARAFLFLNGFLWYGFHTLTYLVQAAALPTASGGGREEAAGAQQRAPESLRQPEPGPSEAEPKARNPSQPGAGPGTFSVWSAALGPEHSKTPSAASLSNMTAAPELQPSLNRCPQCVDTVVLIPASATKPN